MRDAQLVIIIINNVYPLEVVGRAATHNFAKYFGASHNRQEMKNEMNEV